MSQDEEIPLSANPYLAPDGEVEPCVKVPCTLSPLKSDIGSNSGYANYYPDALDIPSCPSVKEFMWPAQPPRATTRALASLFRSANGDNRLHLAQKDLKIQLRQSGKGR